MMSLFALVHDAWASLVARNTSVFIGLLIAGEGTAGMLPLSGGRWKQSGLVMLLVFGRVHEERTEPPLVASLDHRFSWRTHMRHKVDPAALLIAVFVVGVGPVLQPGEWSYITTVTGTITLLVLVAFSWPTREAIRREPLSRTMIAAYSAVYAFVIAILASWPAQTWAEDGLDLKACTDPSMAPDVLSYLTATDCIAVNRDILGEAGTTGGIIVGAASFPILALGLWLWQSYAAKRTKQRRPEAWSVPDGWESV